MCGFTLESCSDQMSKSAQYNGRVVKTVMPTLHEVMILDMMVPSDVTGEDNSGDDSNSDSDDGSGDD